MDWLFKKLFGAERFMENYKKQPAKEKLVGFAVAGSAGVAMLVLFYRLGFSQQSDDMAAAAFHALSRGDLLSFALSGASSLFYSVSPILVGLLIIIIGGAIFSPNFRKNTLWGPKKSNTQEGG